MWWLSCVPEYFLYFFFFNCFFISSWIAMFSYSGDFEVLLLVSFHRFCSFCHCLCYCKVMEMYLYVDLGLFFGRFWSLPYFPIKSFHANLRILSSLNPKINQIKFHSFIQSRKKLQELHKIYLSHFVSVFSDLNVFMRFFVVWILLMPS